MCGKALTYFLPFSGHLCRYPRPGAEVSQVATRNRVSRSEYEELCGVLLKHGTERLQRSQKGSKKQNIVDGNVAKQQRTEMRFMT